MEVDGGAAESGERGGGEVEEEVGGGESGEGVPCRRRQERAIFYPVRFLILENRWFRRSESAPLCRMRCARADQRSGGARPLSTIGISLTIGKCERNDRFSNEHKKDGSESGTSGGLACFGASAAPADVAVPRSATHSTLHFDNRWDCPPSLGRGSIGGIDGI